MRRSNLRIESLALIFLLGGTFWQASAQQIRASKDSVQRLPSFELPEFVITGKEAIDLPQFAKALPADNGDAYPGTISAGIGTKDREPLLAGAQKLTAPAEADFAAKSIRLSAGYGTFHTPLLEGLFGRDIGKASLSANLSYQAVGDYVPFAGWRVGQGGIRAQVPIDGDGTTTHESENLLSGATLVGGFEAIGRTYNLFGSAAPDLHRSATRINGFAGIQSMGAAGWRYKWVGSIESYRLEDSTKSRETIFGINGDVRKGFGRFEGCARLTLDFNSLSGASAQSDPNYSAISLNIQPDVVKDSDNPLLKMIQWRTGVTAYIARNSDGSSATRFYPDIYLGFIAIPKWTLFAEFKPELARKSLSVLGNENPYIVASPIIRHTDIKTSFTVGARWEPSASFRSQLSLSFQRMEDQPLLTDVGSKGTWSLLYGGTTEVFLIRSEMFWHPAEATSVSLSWLIRESKNSTTNGAVPYWPSLLNVGIRHRLLRSLIGALGAEVVSSWTDRSSVGTTWLTSFVRLNAELQYTISENFRIFLSGNNLLDRRFEYWKGYREPPLWIRAGITIQL